MVVAIVYYKACPFRGRLWLRQAAACIRALACVVCVCAARPYARALACVMCLCRQARCVGHRVSVDLVMDAFENDLSSLQSDPEVRTLHN